MTQQDRQYEQLTAYLDGELGESERSEVERLLARDAEARRVLDELRATARMVGGLPRAAAPRGLSAEITARMEREALLGDAPDSFQSASQQTTPIWQRGLAMAAALGMIVTAGWLMWPELPKPPSERPVITVADADSPRSKAVQSESEAPSRLLKEERVAFAAKPQAVPGRGAAPMSLNQVADSYSPVPAEIPNPAEQKMDSEADLAADAAHQRIEIAPVPLDSASESTVSKSRPESVVAGIPKSYSSIVSEPEATAQSKPPVPRFTRAKWRYVAPVESAGNGGDGPIVHRIDIEIDSPAREKVMHDIRVMTTSHGLDPGVQPEQKREWSAVTNDFDDQLNPVRIDEGDGVMRCTFELNEGMMGMVEGKLARLIQKEVDQVEQEVTIDRVNTRLGGLAQGAKTSPASSQPVNSGRRIRLIVQIMAPTTTSQPASFGPSTMPASLEVHP